MCPGKGTGTGTAGACLDISDFCSVLVNTVKDILQVAGIDLQETALYHLPGEIIPGDTDIWPFG